MIFGLKSVALNLLLFNVFLGIIKCKTFDFYDHVDSILAEYDKEFGGVMNREQLLTWNYLTNLTGDNANQLKDFRQNIYDWKREWSAWAKKSYRKIACNTINISAALETNQSNNKRCFYLSKIMSSFRFANRNELSLFNALRSGLSKQYAKLNVEINGRTMVGETEITRFLSESEDLNEIKSAWNQWYENSNKMLPMFTQLLNLFNKTANYGSNIKLWDVWISDLNMRHPLKNAHKLWREVQEFYTHIHAFVRGKLREKYGDGLINKTDSIPIYLMKSLWADQWNSIIAYIKPFQSKNSEPSYSENIQSNSYDGIKELLSESQRVFTDLGFETLDPKFWQNSIFTKPREKTTTIDCHPLAFDFMDGSDFRVKLCLTGQLKRRDSELRTIVHELGHIYYFKSYANIPNMLRSAPMSAFHEAIGDLMVLISNACKWENADYGDIINGQISEALNNFVIIPWALSLEQWRHDLFSGNLSITAANRHYWDIRERFQGINAPPERYFAFNLDPIAKYHVANFMPYLRYFYSRFLSHQFHKALCPQTDIPLYRCCPKQMDTNFWKMLSTGSMLPWNVLLKHLTGSFDIISAPLLDYYKPLNEWLISTITKNNYPIGWN